MTEKDRIEALIRHEGLSLSQFANEINIQGSTLSHIMSGRNNPSLDVMKRILERFPNINPDWLIFGKEPRFRQISQSHEMPSLFDEPELSASTLASSVQVPETLSISTETKEEKTVVQSSRTITRVVIFYSDNTFEEIAK